MRKLRKKKKEKRKKRYNNDICDNEDKKAGKEGEGEFDNTIIVLDLYIYKALNKYNKYFPLITSLLPKNKKVRYFTIICTYKVYILLLLF